LDATGRSVGPSQIKIEFSEVFPAQKIGRSTSCFSKMGFLSSEKSEKESVLLVKPPNYSA
jgi:hypothetical protein